MIKRGFFDIKLYMGMYQPTNQDRFLKGVKKLLCTTFSSPQNLNKLIRGTVKIPGEMRV